MHAQTHHWREFSHSGSMLGHSQSCCSPATAMRGAHPPKALHVNPATSQKCRITQSYKDESMHRGEAQTLQVQACSDPISESTRCMAMRHWVPLVSSQGQHTRCVTSLAWYDKHAVLCGTLQQPQSASLPGEPSVLCCMRRSLLLTARVTHASPIMHSCIIKRPNYASLHRRPSAQYDAQVLMLADDMHCAGRLAQHPCNLSACSRQHSNNQTDYTPM